MRVLRAFDKTEGAILSAMYEVANGTYDSYSLAKRLNPTVEGWAFTETRDATERLIVRRLVNGERLSGADGVYFRRLKLTTKGQQAAIQRRTEAEELKKALAEAVPVSNAVIKEMQEMDGKNK